MSIKTLRTLRRPLAIFAMLAVAGCTEIQEPAFYLLQAPPEAPATSGSEIGLREVDLPLYARRPQIPVLATDGSVSVSDTHRWAEEPARATTRLIGRAIAARLTRPIVIEPWPAEISPEVRVDVDIDYLIGALAGELRLEGQYRTFAAGRPDTAKTTRFSLTEQVAGPSYGDLVAAQSRALIALGDAIATDLGRLDR